MIKRQSNISKDVLVITYKRFKRNPLKVFVARDFVKANGNKFRSNHLNTLIRLGLIEEVKVVYFTGIKYKTKRRAKGYKLRK